MGSVGSRSLENEEPRLINSNSDPGPLPKKKKSKIMSSSLSSSVKIKKEKPSLQNFVVTGNENQEVVPVKLPPTSSSSSKPKSYCHKTV